MVSYAITRTLPIMPLVTAVFVLVFGGLTLLLANDLFIKLKPTIVNLTFAAILFVGLKTGRLFIKLVLESAVQLTERGWIILTRAWIGFFIVLAALNEIVWRTLPTDAWVHLQGVRHHAADPAVQRGDCLPVMLGKHSVQQTVTSPDEDTPPVDRA